MPIFYTHLMEGEALDHDPFLWVLPDRQGALGLQQVVNLLVVDLEGGARSEAELCSPSSEQREAPSIGITPDLIRRSPPTATPCRPLPRRDTEQPRVL